jgi:anti-sigma regulatory factor (Ser/Thr protein kinase)
MVALSRWLAAPDSDDQRWIRVEESSAAGGARNTALAIADRLAFPQDRAERLALAVTEAASNLYKHAREGTLLLRVSRDADPPGIELVTIDVGPGITDLAAALRDGSSTAGTLGIGLGAIRRIADFSDVYSLPGHGTTLVARFLAQPARPAGAAGRRAGLTRPISGETECGDGYAAGPAGPAGTAAQVVTAVLCDGLGHGPMAAAASREAIAAIREAPDGEPAALVERAHRRMGRTRGGAIAVVRIDGESATFAGLGNVAAWIVTGETRQGMISVPGIAGHQARKFRQYQYVIEPGAAVILHSDGLSSRWNIRDLPGLTRRDPLLIAATLLSEAGVHRDDASVLVLIP